jgi:hypothetical protein
MDLEDRFAPVGPIELNAYTETSEIQDKFAMRSHSKMGGNDLSLDRHHFEHNPNFLEELHLEDLDTLDMISNLDDSYPLLQFRKDLRTLRAFI